MQHHWDVKALAGIAVLVGLVSGLFAWLLGLVGLVPIIGPIVVKLLSFSFIWLLNALGYLLSYVAIRRGYSQDVLTYRGLTLALMIGVIIGYVLAQFIWLKSISVADLVLIPTISKPLKSISWPSRELNAYSKSPGTRC